MTAPSIFHVATSSIALDRIYNPPPSSQLCIYIGVHAAHYIPWRSMLHAANLSPAVAASELLKANTSAGTQPCGIAVSYYFMTRLTYFTIKRARRVLAKELSFLLPLSTFALPN